MSKTPNPQELAMKDFQERALRFQKRHLELVREEKCDFINELVIDDLKKNESDFQERAKQFLNDFTALREKYNCDFVTQVKVSDVTKELKQQEEQSKSQIIKP